MKVTNFRNYESLGMGPNLVAKAKVDIERTLAAMNRNGYRKEKNAIEIGYTYMDGWFDLEKGERVKGVYELKLAYDIRERFKNSNDGT